jgi:hypothetical protein
MMMIAGTRMTVVTRMVIAGSRRLAAGQQAS